MSSGVRNKGWNISFLLLIIVISAVFAYFFLLFLTLPSPEDLRANLEQSSVIQSEDGVVLARLGGDELHAPVPLQEVSPYLRQAILAVEDRRFYKHGGLDLLGLGRAVVINLMQGRFAEGGSTLTQQLARTLYLSRRKTIHRKLQELLVALTLESQFSKDEIFEMYLSYVYWGHNTQGVDGAARMYFGKSPADLRLAEAATLAGLLEAPEYYSPYKNSKRSLERRIEVLRRMVGEKFITDEEAEVATKEKLVLATTSPNAYKYIAPYFTSFIVSELLKKYDTNQVYHGNLVVQTTLDFRLQKIAQSVVNRFVSEEGAKYQFSEMAMVVLDPRSGDIRAMVGGSNFRQSEFNRSVQAKRSPGSSFKPIIYATAIEMGYSPGHILNDAPITLEVPVSKWTPTGSWKPQNFDSKFRGKMTIREAVEQSRNVPTIGLLQEIGPNNALRMAQRLGITSYIEPQLSMALGAYEVSLLELAGAYTALANSGVRTKPRAVKSVHDKRGNLLDRSVPQAEKVLDENVVAVMVDIMQGVIRRGTGHRANIGRPAAAKTGTSQEFRDAWFIGFVPQLLVAVWVGNDNNRSMKGVAEVSVCPRAWKAFMEEALRPEPVIPFTPPQGMTQKTFCLISGQLATPYCPKEKVRTDIFFPTNAPHVECPIHSESSDDESEEEEVEEVEQTS